MNVIAAFLVGLTVELVLYTWLFRVSLRRRQRDIAIVRAPLSAIAAEQNPAARPSEVTFSH